MLNPLGLSGEPLLGITRDLHSLDNARAEHTTKAAPHVM